MSTAGDMKNSVCCTLIFCLGVCAANLYFGPTVSNGACYGGAERLTEFQGIIRAPVARDWLQELNCTWIIVASSREMVTIRFESLDLTCYSGLLTIWAPGRAPSRLCSVLRPRPLTFLGGSVHINLRAAYSPRPGFKLTYVK
ncbi:low-density lipoprotein receptor-related protein 10-like, partial [Mustelus asterias]